LESNSDVAHKTIQEFNDPLDSLLLTLDIDSLQNVLSSSEIYYGLKNLSYEQKKQLAERVIFRENNF
jgi:arginase family enzyme